MVYGGKGEEGMDMGNLDEINECHWKPKHFGGGFIRRYEKDSGVRHEKRLIAESRDKEE